jgi:transposase-like protein
MPRDRQGSFEPQIVPKHARRLAGFNEQVLSLYARGMSVRDIRAHLAQMYGVEPSASTWTAASTCSGCGSARVKARAPSSG